MATMNAVHNEASLADVDHRAGNSPALHLGAGRYLQAFRDKESSIIQARDVRDFDLGPATLRTILIDQATRHRQVVSRVREPKPADIWVDVWLEGVETDLVGPLVSSCVPSSYSLELSRLLLEFR
jgi:hypothetical protein